MTTLSNDLAGRKTPEADALFKYVQAAANLRLEIAAFERDQSLFEGGKRIVYCVDTNIVNLYLDPERMGPEGPNGGGRYGVVFPGDSKELSAALAAALSRFIFFDLGDHDEERSLPLVLLLGHDAEVRNYYDVLSKTYEHQLMDISARRRQLRQTVTEILETGADPLTYEDQIYELLYGSSNDAEKFNRINRLITDRRIGRLAALTIRIADRLANARVPAEQFREALSVPNTIREKIEESARRNWWRKKLTEAVPRRSPGRLHVDSCALARLEMVNRRLARLDAVLVLITGDEAMHKVAASYTVEDGQSTPHETFAFKYLRHPRAFLSSTTILARTDAEPSAGGATASLTTDWLEPLLSRYMTQVGPRFDILREFSARPQHLAIPDAIREAATNHPATVDALAKEWQVHANRIRRQNTISSELARGEIRRVLGAAAMADIRPALERLDDDLVAQSEMTWQAFFGAVAHAGYQMALSGTPRPRSRTKSAPAVVFDSFSATSEFVRRALSHEPGYDLGEDLDNSLAAIEEEDPFHYAKILAYSILFASSGNWYVSRVLAIRAIEIARWIEKEYPKRQSTAVTTGDHAWLEQARKISGREAYYCAAVAARNTANSDVELLKAEEYGAKATNLLKIDRQRDDPTSVTELRFEAERQALELTRILFLLFSPSKAKGGVPGNVLGRLQTMISSLKAIVTDADHIKDDFLRISIRRTCLTNVFMALMLLERESQRKTDSGSMSPESPTPNWEPWVRAFRTNIDDKEPRPIYVTDLVRAVSLYVNARFEVSSRSELRKLTRLINDFEVHWNREKSEHLLMPYDDARFAFIIQATREAISRLHVV